jgi:hypothetical protein
MSNLIADHKRGDTWDGISFLYKENDLPINLTGATVLAQFKTNPLGKAAFEFKTSDGTVTIPNPLTGELFLIPRIMNYEASTYQFDVQIVFLDGTINTDVDGLFRITQDISR